MGRHTHTHEETTHYYTTMSQYWPLCPQFLEINFGWSFSAASLIISVSPLKRMLTRTNSPFVCFIFRLSPFLPPSLSSSLWCAASDFPNCVFHQTITARKYHGVLDESVTAECPWTSSQRRLMLLLLYAAAANWLIRFKHAGWPDVF